MSYEIPYPMGAELIEMGYNAVKARFRDATADQMEAARLSLAPFVAGRGNHVLEISTALSDTLADRAWFEGGCTWKHDTATPWLDAFKRDGPSE